MDLDESEACYQRARAFDPVAWRRLRALASRELVDWLARRHRRLKSPRLREIAESAFARASEEFGRVPTWPQAWTYLVKTALSLLKEDSRRCLPGAEGLRGVPDGRAVLRLRAIESSADLQALWRRVDRASQPLGNLLLELIEQVERGEAPSLRGAALELGLAVRTVERRRKALRDLFQRLALEGGWAWLAARPGPRCRPS